MPPAESAANGIGRISFGAKRAGKRSAGKPPAPFDVAGVGDGFTAGLLRHSQRKRGATDRPGLRNTAPALDPTIENLSLENIAASVGIHPTHFARAFRRHCGCTPGEYIRQLRVEFARRQLANSNRPLSEIALDSGFSDQSHFNKVFKRATGFTPAAYRRTFRTR